MSVSERPEGGEGGDVGVRRRRVPCRRNSQCKGPETGVCLLC